MRERLAAQRCRLLAMVGLLAPACATDADTASGGEDMGAGPLDAQAGGGDLGTLPDVRVPDARPSSDGAPPPPAGPCADPVPIREGVDGPATGFVRCPDGRVERVAAPTCADPLPAGACPPGLGGECSVDSDCVARAHGRCSASSFDDQNACYCQYGCASDADCPDGSICACGDRDGDAQNYPDGSGCVPSTCLTNADCGSGACRLGSYAECDWTYQLACSTATDACASTADCEGGEGCLPREQGWMCDYGAVCGRPLVVQGRNRVAAVVERGGWGHALAGSGDPRRTVDLPWPLSDRERAHLAAHWAEMGAMEHASIASFARFSLALLQHGAPPALLADAARAAGDEVDHAQRCFAVAGALTGAAVGPGPLQTSDAALPASFAALVAETIRDACVNETLAAAEAAHLAECVEPALRETFTVIAADELRHAALGWNTLRWALRRPDAPTAAQVRAVFATSAAALIDGLATGPGPGTPDLRRFGLLDVVERRRLFECALDVVVAPCLEALLAEV
jgi:hypothetical protein